MGLNVEDIIAGLDPARRRKIEEMAAELIAEAMTLRELRKARQLTQASVARARHQPVGTWFVHHEYISSPHA